MNKDIIKEESTVISMDQFLGKASSLYPEIREMDFKTAIELVVDKTNSYDDYQRLQNESGNLFDLLEILSERLPIAK